MRRGVLKPMSANKASAGPDRYKANRYSEASTPLGARNAPSKGLLLDSLVNPQNEAEKSANDASPAENSSQGAVAISVIQDPMRRYSEGRDAMLPASGSLTKRATDAGPNSAMSVSGKMVL